jgi:hypothetical protein
MGTGIFDWAISQGLLLKITPEKISLQPRLRRLKLIIFAIVYHFYPLNFAVPSMLIARARDFSPRGSALLASRIYPSEPWRPLLPPRPI